VLARFSDFWRAVGRDRLKNMAESKTKNFLFSQRDASGVRKRLTCIGGRLEAPRSRSCRRTPAGDPGRRSERRFPRAAVRHRRTRAAPGQYARPALRLGCQRVAGLGQAKMQVTPDDAKSSLRTSLPKGQVFRKEVTQEAR
jgi:hypothetical protein